MNDWADKEAAEIVELLINNWSPEAVEILACRLRIIKCLGVEEGIQNVSKSLERVHEAIQEQGATA